MIDTADDSSVESILIPDVLELSQVEPQTNVTASGRKRNRERRMSKSYLSFEQKIQVINKKKEDPGMTQGALAEWASRSFNTSSLISQATISNIIRNSATILSTTPRDLRTKRVRKLYSEKLDTALSYWGADVSFF